MLSEMSVDSTSRRQLPEQRMTHAKRPGMPHRGLLAHQGFGNLAMRRTMGLRVAAEISTQQSVQPDLRKQTSTGCHQVADTTASPFAEAESRPAILQARLGVQPDAMAATALVDACARNGKMDMALSVFDELFGGWRLNTLHPLLSSTALSMPCRCCCSIVPTSC